MLDGPVFACYDLKVVFSFFHLTAVILIGTLAQIRQSHVVNMAVQTWGYVIAQFPVLCKPLIKPASLLQMSFLW